ncbi:copper amine oxidase N-terminal domain-containing protein [Desulfofundulus thermocisternus]|uniref:copper amine oxidase N-terminal domain-containing protein n=1 Tax=Desulfofundulus thermocisternus TaxID=42471 RepID=UPI0019F83693|nr:copper amine oxidase N-terminal domain-containing protein [Desulfofundulus thermocisternus]MBE3585168.1 copper amine oxidase N-terminal domain-containing protein [Thermoanaerobacter sp.]MCS5696011.1 copper amine oxidase N-terminal domain-containing protein [Desulfofundulus thermocisternus]
MRKGSKLLSLTIVVILLLSLVSAAWAAPPNDLPDRAKGFKEKNTWQEKEKNYNKSVKVEAREVQSEQEQNRHREQEKFSVRENVYEKRSVQKHVYTGIENALQHVKNPVARAALEAIVKGESVPEAVYKAKESLENWKNNRVEVTLVVEALKEALEEDESIDDLTLSECYKRLGELLIDVGEMLKARDFLEEALLSNPEDEDSYIVISKVFAKMKDTKVKVYVKGTMPGFDVTPRVEKGRVLVPLRALAEALGATVEYKDNAIVIKQGDNTVTLVIGNKKALVDGKPVMLEVPAKVVGGRTLVPLRFIGEGLKAKVNYYPEGKVVSILGK